MVVDLPPFPDGPEIQCDSCPYVVYCQCVTSLGSPPEQLQRKPPAWPQHKILCETFDKLFRTVYTAPYILLEYLWNGTDLLLSGLAIVRFGNRLFRRGNLIIFEETVFTEKTGLRD